MRTLQITCIRKNDRMNPYERIQSVGGSENGSPFRMSQADVIRHIDSGTAQFYVSVRGQSVWVITAVSQYGNKYIKTESDGEEPNNLLSLPECP